MTDYRILYLFKNNPKIVQRFLNQFLLFQIYSPEIIRQAFRRWPEVPEFIRQSTPEDAEDLIESSFMFSEDELKSKINRYYIENAVWVLKNYQNCAVPLTKDPIVKQTQRKLTSKQGDKALKILQKAKTTNILNTKHKRPPSFHAKLGTRLIKTAQKEFNNDSEK